MSQEVKNTLDALNTAFTQFKAANDERLKQIENKGSADAVLTETVEKLNSTITNLQAQVTTLENRASRPVVTVNGREQTPEARAHKAGFEAFMRKGVEDGLRDLEIKAAHTTTTDADGGYAVPEELDRAILDRLVVLSPMRQVANVVTVGRGYKKLVNRGGTTSGWVGETDARPATATSQLEALTPHWGEIYANPGATQTSLDDMFFNVEQFMQDEVDLEFAIQEGPAFISGNGTNKPKGFLAYTMAAAGDATRTFQQIQYIASGNASLLNNTDKLIDVVHSLNPRLRQGAVWLMNSLTVGELRKLKDSEGNYLWRPGLEQGQSTTLLGYGVTEMEGMPDIAADAFPVAFGNFKRGYKITDRIGTRVLRDPFTNKPYVHFYTTKRVGGYVEDANAIKTVKIAVA